MERKNGSFCFEKLGVNQEILVERTDRPGHPGKVFRVARIGSRVTLRGPSGQRLKAKIEDLVRYGEERGGRFRFSPIQEVDYSLTYKENFGNIEGQFGT